VQDKVWATDPDGNKWEVFVVLEAESDQYASDAAGCCNETQDSVCCASPAASSEPCCS
jgi:hypothetical protein